MKIIYLSTAGFPSEVTHTLSILRVCKALSDRGHDVLLTGRRLLAKTDQDVFEYYGLARQFQVALETVGRILNNRWARFFEVPGLFLAWRFRKTLRRFAPDLVYSRLTLVELFAVPRELPLIYEMHSPGALTHKGWRRWVFCRQMRLLNVQHIVVTTNTLKAYIHENLPGIAVRVARLSAEAPMAIAPDQLNDFRGSTLRGAQFKFNVGYTGFLHQVRGIGVVLKAAALLPDVGFHIVGGAPDAVAEWQRYAIDEGVSDNVFFYGHRPAAEIPFFLHCFDVFLAPLQKPDQPLTFMSPLKVPQYLAYGKPIIASDVVPHQEQLQHGVTALLVEAEDPMAWAQAVRDLRADSTLRAQLGDAARAYHQAELTPQRRLEIILQDVN